MVNNRNIVLNNGNIGVSNKWRYPNWMVYFMENPIEIRMMTGGTPMTEETSQFETSEMVIRCLGQEWRFSISNMKILYYIFK